MARLILLALFWSLCILDAAEAAPPLSQKALVAQVDRLTELLRDSHAVGYPPATFAQVIDLRADRQLVLAVFTVQGFGGGNNHSQYLAAFETDDETKPPHYSLIDVIHVAGKGWRGIEKLNARVSQQSKSGIVSIDIDALEVAPEDPPNFPSRKSVISLVLSQGRLVEKSPKR